MRFKRRFFLTILLFTRVLVSYSYNPDYKIEATYNNKLSSNIVYNKKYKGPNPDVIEYVFVITRQGELKSTPDITAKTVLTLPYDTKLKVLERLFVKSNLWYKVEHKGNEYYVSASYVYKRIFRFNKAIHEIKKLENFIKTETAKGREIAVTHSYVPNPGNKNLVKSKDKYGMSIDQNIIGKNAANENIYVADRSILSIVKSNDSTTRVNVSSIPEELNVTSSYLRKVPNEDLNFKKVIAIDVTNQNMMVFEKNGSEWELISYVYSKTGSESKLGFDTPKGAFFAAMGKFYMPYNDENGQKQGFARFAIRFSGGGYLHGTPLVHQEEINSEFFMNKKERTLGTYAGTRKCVRTSEDHAKFLFNWLYPDKNSKTNEQYKPNRAAFVIF